MILSLSHPSTCELSVLWARHIGFFSKPLSADNVLIISCIPSLIWLVIRNQSCIRCCWMSSGGLWDHQTRPVEIGVPHVEREQREWIWSFCWLPSGLSRSPLVLFELSGLSAHHELYWVQIERYERCPYAVEIVCGRETDEIYTGTSPNASVWTRRRVQEVQTGSAVFTHHLGS